MAVIRRGDGVPLREGVEGKPPPRASSGGLWNTTPQYPPQPLNRNLWFQVRGRATPKLAVFRVPGFVTTEPVTRQYVGVLPAAGTRSAPVGTAGRSGFRSLIGPIVIPGGAAARAAPGIAVEQDQRPLPHLLPVERIDDASDLIIHRADHGHVGAAKGIGNTCKAAQVLLWCPIRRLRRVERQVSVPGDASRSAPLLSRNSLCAHAGGHSDSTGSTSSVPPRSSTRMRTAPAMTCLPCRACPSTMAGQLQCTFDFPPKSPANDGWLLISLPCLPHRHLDSQ